MNQDCPNNRLLLHCHKFITDTSKQQVVSSKHFKEKIRLFDLAEISFKLKNVSRTLHIRGKNYTWAKDLQRIYKIHFAIKITLRGWSQTVFKVGFSSFIKSISKIKQSNLLWHFRKILNLRDMSLGSLPC